MRIGIYGGTFDPIHYGHLLAAEQCREQCRLDRVLFIPAGVPPHKQDANISPGAQRADMLEFAIAGYSEFDVDRREIKRSGPSFTVETLRELRQELPDDELFLLMGADSLMDLPLWREPREIASLANLLVINRGKETGPDPGLLEPHLGPEGVTRIQLVSMPGIDLAASDIRRRFRDGKSVRFMIPRAVEQYIREQELYTNSST